MSAKKSSRSSDALHVRLPAGLKDQLKRQAGNDKTLGAHVTDILLAAQRSPRDWSLELKNRSLKAKLGICRARWLYMRWMIAAHSKRMREEGKEPDVRLVRQISDFNRRERAVKKAAAAMKRHRREREAAHHSDKRPLNHVFAQTVGPPAPSQSVDALTVYDWRWLSLREALTEMKRGEQGRFAKAVGISPSMLSRYQSPRISRSHRPISKAVAHRMAKELGVDPATFDKWDQEKVNSMRLQKSVDALVESLRSISLSPGHSPKRRAPARLSNEDRVRL